MLRSLNCGVFGVVAPTPQSHNPLALLLGSLKRNAVKVGSLDSDLKAELAQFVRTQVADFPRCETLDPNEWLIECKLPLYKKQEMIREYEKFKEQECFYWNKTLRLEWTDLRKSSIFGKAEHLTEYGKTLRAINPTSAAYKYIVGPYFHWLEKYLFYQSKHSKNFIKSVPVKDRPRVIKERLGEEYKDSKTFTTDYSSFEDSFDFDVMNMLEMILYEHCFGHLHVWPYIKSLVGTKTKNNEHGTILKHKQFLIETTSCRMSGEMNTSLGNGFSNWMLTKFCCHKIGAKNLRGVFEGDDGLFRYEGSEYPVHLAPKLGFSLKIQKAELHRASFCGNIFDLDSMTVITDPWYTLAVSGFSFNAVGCSLKTLSYLTAAKGISLMYQFSNCPVLPHLGRRMLRTAMTELKQTEQQIRHVLNEYYLKSQKVDWWERTKILESVNHTLPIEIHNSTRALMELHYGFDVSLQYHVEQLLDSGIGWLHDPVLLTAYTHAEVKQLDGSTIRYSSWIDNFSECVVHDSTPSRIGYLPGINKEFKDLIEIFDYIKYDPSKIVNCINVPFPLQ